MKNLIIYLTITLFIIQKSFAFVPPDSTERLNMHKTSSTVKEAVDEVKAVIGVNDRSNTNAEGEKRYYDTFKIFLNADDEVTFVHQSNSFRVMFSISSPDRKTDFTYDSQQFEGTSSNTFFYKPKSTGIYTLFASSADPNKTGGYSIKKTIQKAKKENSNDPFVLSIKELLDLRKNKYQGMMGEKLSEKEGKYVFDSKYFFIPNKKGEIIIEDGGKVYTYQSVLFEGDTEADAQQYFNELANKLVAYARAKDWFSEPLDAKSKTMYISSETDIITLKLKPLNGKYVVLFVCN
jgi:hypothetical protein